MSKSDKKGAGFNTPFKDLKAVLKKAEPPKPEPPKKGAPGRPAAPPPPKRRDIPLEQDDEALFRIAMSGIQRLPDSTGHAPAPPPHEPHIVTDDAEVLARLGDLVSGGGDFDIANTDEFIEGGVPGLDGRIVQALRRGEYAVQGHLDLHGLNQSDAKDAVDRFLTQSRKEGKRCVLIIHGRGLNSKDQIPVLKERLQVWLNRGRIGRSVLAFATARPHDGGAGAVYVLLRR